MYKGFELISYRYDNFPSMQDRYRVKIIDEHFEDVVVAEMPRATTGGIVVAAIIECYGKRNLPIAPNIIRQMLQVQEEDGWSLDRQVEWNKQYNPRWKEVEQDMQMYLAFS